MSGGARSGVVWLTVGQVVFVASGYVAHIVLARSLGPAAYGTYGVLLSVLSTVALMLTAGMPEAIAKFASETPGQAGAIFRHGLRIQFLFSVVLAAAYAVASPLVARLLNDTELELELAASALAIPPVAAYAVVIGAYNGARRFAAQAACVAGYGVLRAALVVGLMPYLGLWGAVSGFVLAPALVVALGLLGMARAEQPAAVTPRALWDFAKPIIVFTVALNALMNLDLFVVKALTPDAAVVGHYTAAVTIAKIPYFVFSTLGVVLLPIVSSAAAQTQGLPELARRSIRYTFLASLGVSAVVAPLAGAAVRTLYGEAYIEAALPLALLVFSGTLFTLFFIVAYTLNGLGKPTVAVRVTLLGLLVEVVLAVTLTRALGPSGAPLASCVASAFILTGLLVAAKPYLGVILPRASLLRGALAFGVTALSGMLLPRTSALSVFFALPLAILNLLCLVVTREFTLSELRSALARSE